MLDFSKRIQYHPISKVPEGKVGFEVPIRDLSKIDLQALHML